LESYLGGSDVRISEPYFRSSIEGQFWKNRSVRYAIVEEMRLIRALSEAIWGRSLFRAPPDDNIETLIGSAQADASAGGLLFVTDPTAAFAAAEAKLTKALSSVPDHALGHMCLGFVDIMTKRATEGIAECEHALALDRNLGQAMF
jgi:hypothetical protein